MKRNLWKRVALFCTALVLCISVAAPLAFAEKPSFTSNEEWEVLRLTNNERAKNGLVPLTAFSALTQVGKLRAREIAQLFSHTRPNGTDCETALGDIPWRLCGENIAAGQSTPYDAMYAKAGWMNSEDHRDNILESGFKHVGIGYCYNANSEYRHYWTQVFVGGCVTKSISISGAQDGKVPANDLSSLIVRVTCDLHGTSYLPLSNVNYKITKNSAGNNMITIQYDGKSAQYELFDGFIDVPVSSWYYKSVYFCRDNGLFEGMDSAHFAPTDSMTRAMYVTVLGRLAGAKVSKKDKSKFSDVPTGQWYSGYVKWAADQGIVEGMDKTHFDPNGNVTREQICKMMVEYCKFAGIALKKADPEINFKDAASISKWAKSYVKQAQMAGFVEGDNGYFYPLNQATRAEVATIFMNFDKNYNII